MVEGIAYGAAATPGVIVLGYYFKKKLGIATGVTFAGVGVGLLAMPPTVEWLCSQYGWQSALLIHSAFNAHIIVSGALYRPSKLEKQILAEGKAPSEKKFSCFRGFGLLKKINQ